MSASSLESLKGQTASSRSISAVPKSSITQRQLLPIDATTVHRKELPANALLDELPNSHRALLRRASFPRCASLIINHAGEELHFLTLPHPRESLINRSSPSCGNLRHVEDGLLSRRATDARTHHRSLAARSSTRGTPRAPFLPRLPRARLISPL